MPLLVDSNLKVSMVSSFVKIPLVTLSAVSECIPAQAKAFSPVSKVKGIVIALNFSIRFLSSFEITRGEE